MIVATKYANGVIAGSARHTSGSGLAFLHRDEQ